MTRTLYTNPIRRAGGSRWTLEEVGAPDATVVVGCADSMKAEACLAVNPMGEVPAARP